jgi:hypothetical protein
MRKSSGVRVPIFHFRFVCRDWLELAGVFRCLASLPGHSISIALV